MTSGNLTIEFYNHMFNTDKSAHTYIHIKAGHND